MKPPGCVALFALLLLLCHSAVTGGYHSTPFTPTSTTLTTSFPGNTSLEKPKPPSESTTNLTASTEEDGSLHQNLNGTNSTESQASPETTAGNVSYSHDASNKTNGTGNFTESPNGASGDNKTLSTQSASITSLTPTTSAPKVRPVVSTSVVSETTWTPSASTRPLISNSTAGGTTSSVAATFQTRRSFTTAVVKGTSASSTSQTTERTTRQSSTSVLSKARVDPPAELNVGDDGSTSSMDPLLVGLVSVFVVTAAAISLLIFLRFRRKNEQPEFRRLQDLPMDDMMEDTPLSMYSY